MSERSEALSQAKLDIYREILTARKKFQSYSPIEKLQYIETAFNNVNNYYSNILFGLNPNNTKFGFMLGRGSTATTFPRGRAIGYNLRSALMEDDPAEVYRVMFHEFRHIWHINASLFGKDEQLPEFLKISKHNRLDNNNIVGPVIKSTKFMTRGILKPFRMVGNSQLYNEKHYTYARHEASLNEIDADNSAYGNLAKIYKEGFLKSERPIKARILLRENTREWINNAKGHAKAVVNVLTFGKLFTHPVDRMVKNGDNSPIIRSNNLCFLSTSQASQVILNNPEQFADEKSIRKSGRLFRQYVNSHGNERHTGANFFGDFSQFTHKRHFSNPKIARFDANGKLRDEEELSSLYNLSGQHQQTLETDTQFKGFASRQSAFARINGDSIQKTVFETTLEETRETQWGIGVEKSQHKPLAHGSINFQQQSTLDFQQQCGLDLQRQEDILAMVEQMGDLGFQGHHLGNGLNFNGFTFHSADGEQNEQVERINTDEFSPTDEPNPQLVKQHTENLPPLVNNEQAPIIDSELEM